VEAGASGFTPAKFADFIKNQVLAGPPAAQQMR
jgi:hypothetical protein